MILNINGFDYHTIKDINIFISDDSPIVRIRLEQILGEIEGIKIIGEAQDVRESIELINKLKPDVVIQDIRMPDGSGIDVLRTIKASIPTVKVIILTNYPYPQYKSICIKNGADYFFDKSIEFDKVVEVIKEL
jgi:DNA-binding NarL/FixJ family response regulator